MRKWLYIGIGLVVIAAGLYGYFLWTENQRLAVQLAAINHPAKSEVKYVTRDVVKVVQKDGTVVERIREVESQTAVTTPVVPAGAARPSARWYLAGSYSIKPESVEFGEQMAAAGRWGVGAGLNVTDSLSIGLRYDREIKSGANWIGVETRINF